MVKMNRKTLATSPRRRAVTLILAGLMAASLGGCDILGQYLNLPNSFLDPSQVGRFDKDNPFGMGEARPVKWPILEQLDVIDDPIMHWANATDPTLADLEPEVKEYSLGSGDTIRVTVYELVVPGAMYERESQINELGSISVQNLGNVRAAGLTPTELERKVGQLAVEKGILQPAGNGNPGPQVSVTLLNSRQRVYSILGATGRPGTYNVLSPDFRLLDAIALAGDIPVQPGMDYLYVIRPMSYGDRPRATDTGKEVPVPTTTGPKTTANPLGEIEALENATKPAPTSRPAPASAPRSDATPRFVRPLPQAMVVSNPAAPATPIQADRSDLEAALNPTPSAPAAATRPAAPANPVAATGPATTRDGLLESAMSQPATEGTPQYVFIDGKLVLLPPKGKPTTGPSELHIASNVRPPTTGPATTGPASLLPPPDKLATQRVIRIPIQQLREGNARYNIVIRPGDIVNVPGAEPGEFYLMGHVARPGVYTLTGRKVTLKQAIAAAAGLDGLAIPRRCELIRRVGTNQEVTVLVNLQKIFEGEQPDLFLKANDIVNVGTDPIAPFLAVTRNAYRASYGWGFVYDKNFADNNNNTGR